MRGLDYFIEITGYAKYLEQREAVELHAFFVLIIVLSMVNNDVHIGQIIKSVFDESGMTVSELAQRLRCERTNVYTIFRRRTVDVELLARLSEILSHNFLDDAIRQYGLDTKLTPQLNLSITYTNLPVEKFMLLAQFLAMLEKKS